MERCNVEKIVEKTPASNGLEAQMNGDTPVLRIPTNLTIEEGAYWIGRARELAGQDVKFEFERIEK